MTTECPTVRHTTTNPTLMRTPLSLSRPRRDGRSWDAINRSPWDSERSITIIRFKCDRMRTDLSVRPVRSDIAQSMSVREHYLHRECPCTQAYGLFNRDGRMVGVCIFGCPSSSTLRKGICGDDEEYHVTELKSYIQNSNIPSNHIPSRIHMDIMNVHSTQHLTDGITEQRKTVIE